MCDIVIIGGGISGVVTAIKSSCDGNRITILERNDSLLKKLLLTGNGRCNYFNDNLSLSNYYSQDMDILSKIMTSSNLNKVLDLYNSLGIIPKIKNGYYYPYSNQASTVRDALLYELDRLGVNIKYNYLVSDIKRDNDKFIINDDIYCDKLVISTGSYSYPKTGSDGMGYSFLKRFGHTIIKPLPALVQLESDFKYKKELSGIRSDVELSLFENDIFIKKTAGEVQLTDYGISGICTFNLTHIITRGLDTNKQEVIKINFIPFVKDNYLEWLDEYSSKFDKNIFMLLSGFLNYKLVRVILKYCHLRDDVYYRDLSSNDKRVLIDTLTSLSYNILKTKDFNHSQVCNGGVSLKEINTSNLSSLVVNNLYITGELLDINGDCGGYNIMNATLSGILVGDDLSD